MNKELIQLAASILEKTSIESGTDLLIRFKPRTKIWVITFDKHNKAYGKSLLEAMDRLMKKIAEKQFDKL